MKTIRFLCIFIIILAMLLIGSPVLANQGPITYTYNTVKNKGFEIFPGIDYGGNKYGATFVTEVSGNNTKGTLSASVNYLGTGPHTLSNTIFGGSWSLTVTTNRKVSGTIFGKIVVPSSIYWGSVNTDQGHAFITLSITGGTEDYKGISGTGTFDGYDNHMSGIYIFGIQVPTVENGKLTLTY
jgi:hypothetical protein